MNERRQNEDSFRVLGVVILFANRYITYLFAVLNYFIMYIIISLRNDSFEINKKKGKINFDKLVLN